MSVGIRHAGSGFFFDFIGLHNREFERENQPMDLFDISVDITIFMDTSCDGLETNDKKKNVKF